MAVVKQHRRAVLYRFVQTVGFMLALGAVTGGLLMLNEMLRIKSWHIETVADAPASLQGEIDAAMQKLPAYDFWSTRPSALSEQLLSAVADLESIEISRTMTGSLQLTATARTPVALWQNGEGEVRFVDSHGTAYRPLAQDEAADLPLLRIEGSDVRKATELLLAMHAAQPRFHTQVSELLSEGDSWKINFNRGQQWIIPQGRNISYEINRVGTLLGEPRWRSGFWRVDTRMDARWFIRPASQQGVI